MSGPQVSLCVATYRRPKNLPILIHSILVQTMSDFELIVVHDGPDEDGSTREAIATFRDDRLRYVESPEHLGAWGHHARLHAMGVSRGMLVGMSNDDNYYAPTYLEELVGALRPTLEKGRTGFSYCNLVHNGLGYKVMNTSPVSCGIDVGCWLVSANVAKSTPWSDFSYIGDGTFTEAIAKAAQDVVKVEKILFVHN